MFRLPIPKPVKVNHLCHKDCSERDFLNLENENKSETIDLESGASKRNNDHLDLLQHDNFHLHSKKIRYK